MRKKLLPRRFLTSCVLALGMAAGLSRSAPPADPASAPVTSLQNELNELAARARPGTLGITVSDLQTGQTWHVNADRSYPMMSVFEAPLGATVLAESDRSSPSTGSSSSDDGT